MTKILKVIIVISALLFLCACGKTVADVSGSTNEVSTSGITSTTAPYVLTTQETFIYTAPETYNSYPVNQSNPIEESLYIPPETQASPTVSQNIEETINDTPTETTEKVYQKTGEMAFSDKSDNKYIKAIVTKYGVNEKNLVALYTVPDNDGNLVLEFDGSTDAQGKLIRNESTLIAIYSIDKNLNSKRASENSSLNEYSYGEMKVMFISTTKYIMPEFEAELKG